MTTVPDGTERKAYDAIIDDLKRIRDDAAQLPGGALAAELDRVLVKAREIRNGKDLAARMMQNAHEKAAADKEKAEAREKRRAEAAVKREADRAAKVREAERVMWNEHVRFYKAHGFVSPEPFSDSAIGRRVHQEFLLKYGAAK